MTSPGYVETVNIKEIAELLIQLLSISVPLIMFVIQSNKDSKRYEKQIKDQMSFEKTKFIRDFNANKIKELRYSVDICFDNMSEILNQYRALAVAVDLANKVEIELQNSIRKTNMKNLSEFDYQTINKMSDLVTSMRQDVRIKQKEVTTSANRASYNLMFLSIKIGSEDMNSYAQEAIDIIVKSVEQYKAFINKDTTLNIYLEQVTSSERQTGALIRKMMEKFIKVEIEFTENIERVH